MIRLAAWAAVLALLAGSASARRHALLIGNNSGGAGVDSLRYAQSDARRFSEVLTRLGGFDPADVRMIGDCDSAGLEEALQGMRRKLGGIEGASPPPEQEDLFLFYYSGHSDRDALRLGSTRFPLDRLREAFQAVPSRVKIGIFDACQSGMLTRFKGGSASRPISLDGLKKVYGQVIIASSAMDERSQESDLLEGSVFTHHWLNGLRGSADMSGDRKVTLNEAYQYAYRMTIETTSRSRAGVQHPAYQFRIHGEGDIMLADLTQGRSGLAFGFRQEGKYLILDKARGGIQADFHKGPDREMLISLPEGAYNVLKVEKDQWRVAEVSIGPGVSDFSMSSLRRKTHEVNKIKGALAENYQVITGPPGPVPIGPSRRWGASLKVGEGAGLLGLALLYNPDPELQLQAGAGIPGPAPDLRAGSRLVPKDLLEGPIRENSAFLLLRKYEGAYFFDTGLNFKTTTLTVEDAAGGASASDTDWELGIPVHFGLEIGPRRSVFGSLSVGYLWMLTGGGSSITARTPGGTFGHGNTAESGLSLGLALGMYLF